MAEFQGSSKWTLIGVFFLAAGFRCASACDSSSKELHICLNIYLERDFPLLEMIMNGQKTSRGRMILEGMDLDNICKHVSSLYNCYWSLLPECDTIAKYDRFMRVMDVLNATQSHLCKGNKNNLKDLLLTSGCLIRSRSYASNCTGFDWMMTWRHVLRMQRSPADTCPDLATYWKCLAERMTAVTCMPQRGDSSSAPHTLDVYRNLVNVWLRHWCAMNLKPDEERRYFYMMADRREEAVRRAREERERRAELSRVS